MSRGLTKDRQKQWLGTTVFVCAGRWNKGAQTGRLLGDRCVCLRFWGPAV